MPDLFEVLASDHRETLELIDGLLHAPHDRPEDHIRMNELTQELVIAASKHEAVEEMYFWPAVRDLGEEGVHLAETGLSEELEGKRILDELDARTPSAPDFDEVLGRFSDAVRAHIRFEEEQVWPVLAPALDLGARQALAAKLERARRLAPTHPYPSAPQSPTALKAVGAATGLMDRARDALTGRGQRHQDEASPDGGHPLPGPLRAVAEKAGVGQAGYEGFELMPLGGVWRSGRGKGVTVDTDPWSGDTLVEIPRADADDLDGAYSAAADAQRSWAARSPAERAAVFLSAAEILDARRAEITGWLVHETGGTVAKAELERGLVRAGMLEAASLPHHVTGTILPSAVPGKENRVYRQPAGVVAVISPWNFPLQLSNRSVAPALAVGNAVVLKPAGDTPVCGGLLLARILEEAGLPAGLLSVVVGSGGEIGDAIVEHPVPAVVSFTGSTPVGEGITRKAGVKRLALELGGNGPLVVLDDADLDLAVAAATFGSFFHQGQICMIANRLIVDARIHDDFVDRLTERVRGLAVGDPADPATDLGPVINASQLEGIREKVSRALGQGARQVLGGDPVGPAGLGLPPHVLLAGPEVATAGEEVFGPVITVLRARGDAEALTLANATEYGLSSAVFSADVGRATRFAMGVEAGMTHINDSPVNDDANTAFGGVKGSGIGRFGGQWAVEEFTTDHWISVQHQPRTYTF